MTARGDSKGGSSVDDKAKCDEEDDLIGQEKPAKSGTEIGLESSVDDKAEYNEEEELISSDRIERSGGQQASPRVAISFQCLTRSQLILHSISTHHNNLVMIPTGLPQKGSLIPIPGGPWPPGLLRAPKPSHAGRLNSPR
ncbi:ubiquitin-like 1-activating enzyme E1 A [Fusarium sp. NRRL 25303]|nr:ubiquitin-like 1-activating enzyme E1 A [Fusarium sp. NRRL 25303]